MKPKNQQVPAQEQYTSHPPLTEKTLLLLEQDGLTLTQAAKLIKGRTGKGVDVNTIWRWCMKGLRNGIRLKSVLVGGQRYTTRQWLQEFITLRTATAEPPTSSPPAYRTPNEREKAAQRATKELNRLWGRNEE